VWYWDEVSPTDWGWSGKGAVTATLTAFLRTVMSGGSWPLGLLWIGSVTDKCRLCSTQSSRGDGSYFKLEGTDQGQKTGESTVVRNFGFLDQELNSYHTHLVLVVLVPVLFVATVFKKKPKVPPFEIGSA